MDVNTDKTAQDYLSISLANSEVQKFGDQENSVAEQGTQAATAAAADQDYFTREEELMMDTQFQELRDEQHKDNTRATSDSWQLENMAFKA